MNEYIEVISQIKPKNNQNFAIADVNDLKGGFYQVSTKNDMHSIPDSKKKQGMLCYVDEDPQEIHTYQLLNNIWTPAQLGGGSGTYKSPSIIIEKIGGVSKSSDFTSGINYETLFNKLFFPNYDIPFPNRKPFFGFTSNNININEIISLTSPDDYYGFDFKLYVTEGYVVIALPSNFYLKKIEDENGLNIVNAFDIIYKAINLNNDVDIYNVYVSPRIKYNKELELTFYTKVSDPIQVKLNSGIFTIDPVDSIINTINIIEGIKSVINKIKISNRDVESILNSITISPKLDISLNSISIKNRDINSELNNISIAQGIKSVLSNIEIHEGSSILNGIVVTEAIKSVINSITITDGRSIINKISLKDGRSILNNISVSESGSYINYISIKSGYSILNSISIKEAIKSIINSIIINK